MALKCDGKYCLPKGDLAMEINCRRFVADSVSKCASTQMYSTRPTRYAEKETNFFLTFRALAESFLNLEQRMKTWHRKICKRLNCIESRIVRCESVLQLTGRELSCFSAVESKTTENAGSCGVMLRTDGGCEGAPVSCETHCNTHSGKKIESWRSQVLSGTRSASSKMPQSQSPSSSHIKATSIEKNKKGARCGLKKAPGRWDYGSSAAPLSFLDEVIPQPFLSCAAKGILSPTDTTTVNDNVSVVGLTPDSAEVHDVFSVSRDFYNSNNCRCASRSSDCGRQKERPQQQYDRCYSSYVLSSNDIWSPFIEEPGKQGRPDIRGLRAADVDPPRRMPELRGGSTSPARRPSVAKLSTNYKSDSESPNMHMRLLQRKLIYSPDEANVLPSQASSLPRNFSVEARTTFSCNRSIAKSHTHDKLAGSLDESARPTSCEKLLNRHCLGCVGADVSSTSPIYVVPHELYTSGNTAGVCYDDRENYVECCGSVIKDLAAVPASPKAAVNSVWYMAAALAHAEQQHEQLNVSLYPPQQSAVSSALLEVSASTA